ncbi:hypothetical protein CHS0354_020036 [Potamilus streckersoni]|uniref:TIR domain-containing protein n=1 Tax=Potamilus streckersoni TaxID=2493646 RepID=A0AAE0S7K2_9BIVA|nr:hypothetical protein CHS0354_020036 [Potamilus streckersoni]
MNNSEPSMDGGSSFIWSTSNSSFEVDKWQKELKMHENFMPSDLRKEYYDVMVLYSEDNRADARKFCDHLKNDIKLKHNESVKAVLYDEFVPQAGSVFKLLETALKRCTYIFFYITKEFCEDKWIELSREECLMEAIENDEKRWCVIPVHTVDPQDANFKIPIGLKSLKGIDYYYNDLFYKNGVRGLIQNRLHQRLEKEKKHQYKQIIWLQNYKRQFSTEIENIKNLEKMETEKEMEERIKGKAVNEVVPTGASQEHQRSITYQGAENSTNGDHNSQAGEQENDMTANNSMQYVDDMTPNNSTKSVDDMTANNSMKSVDDMTANNSTKSVDDMTANNSTQSVDDMTANYSMQSVDHPFPEGNTNLMESWGPSAYGNIPNISMLDSQDSTMATGTINLLNEDTRPLQGENPTGTSHDETGLPNFDVLTPNPSFDWMNLTSNDQSETSDTSSSPLSQKSSGQADAITASMVLNIYHVENLQVGEKSTIIKFMQTDEKSKNEVDNSNTCTGVLVYNEHNDEDLQKPEDLPIPASRSVAELNDDPASVASQQGSRQSQDCMNLSFRISHRQELGHLLENETKTEKEEKQILGTSLNVDIESWKEEEGCELDVNKRDQPKDPQKKPVGKMPPSPLVSLTPSMRKFQDRNSGEKDLNTVAAVASNDMVEQTMQETLLQLVIEPKTTNRDSPCGETAVNQYQITWRSPALLLARAFPFVSLQDVVSSLSVSTHVDHFSQDEVD